MWRVLSCIVCLTLFGAAQPAFAEAGPLAPGKAEGVERAQNIVRVDKLAAVGGIGLILVGVYLVVGTHYNGYTNKHSNPSASGTH